MKSFQHWHKTNEATINAGNEILLDKLAQGINGVEWLVAQIVIDEYRIESLERWLFFLKIHKHTDVRKVMQHALLLNEKKFYRRYRCNWWISVDETLTHLRLQKERDYDWYFDFLNETYKER
ncbi:hypothetical protein SAMN02799630_01193 [Paenibacillus sp. UNCCL117]|uniref:hypothetical protein n=1 Tax=unclassified Paenibacillus TaxID=185978 RepID=UPI000889F321|nr:MULTISPECIES: hypothetical protein [unclassified Paenibacillus]SDC69028.1 hypothetical protein SAMN04488602_103171 [Paenibacillus sp. cl123]SFW23796.1 hypothetical protein SAMN02799630_01193 [Paenibacillus sp. UNCCL117]